MYLIQQVVLDVICQLNYRWIIVDVTYIRRAELLGMFECRKVMLNGIAI